LSLAKDSPETRTVQDADFGPVVEISEVGGLHHHYERRVA
jgi:putative transposase